VRLITATNRDLKQEVSQGRFREDLFYRLNVVHFHLPPLREKLDDLPLLAEHFLKVYSEESGLPPRTLARETLRLMFAYSWPGNVRELGNAIERGVVLSSGSEIRPEDLPDEIRQPYKPPDPDVAALQPGQVTGGWSPPALPEKSIELKARSAEAGSTPWLLKVRRLLPEGLSLEAAISALEEGLLRAALTAGGGVQSRAAEALGLKKNSFKYKWDKYADREPDPLASALAKEAPVGLPLTPALEDLEETLLKEALERAGGIQSRAADLLGIKKNLMKYKLDKFNLHPKA
jgi:DNA-binding NtrC family response regulator